MSVIRWRQPGDEAAIVRLVRTELVPLSTRPYMRGSKLRQEMSERLRRGETLVATRSARSDPFAFVHMEFRGTTLFIDLLAVEASEQNRRWGTVLMLEAERHGMSRGCREVRLFVDEKNTRGRRFYEKLGYSVVRHLPGAYCYELIKQATVPWP